MIGICFAVEFSFQCNCDMRQLFLLFSTQSSVPQTHLSQLRPFYAMLHNLKYTQIYINRYNGDHRKIRCFFTSVNDTK